MNCPKCNYDWRKIKANSIPTLCPKCKKVSVDKSKHGKYTEYNYMVDKAKDKD